METIMETKICSCWREFNITQKDTEFYDKISPIFQKNWELRIENWEEKWIIDLWNWKFKYLIPPPQLCPDCRQQKRLSFRNERFLYKRTCDATGKSMVSIYSPDKPYTIYSQEEWWSDRWDPLDYGMDFDFSKTFFKQFDELYHRVPIVSLITDFTKDENSAYTNFAGSNKNCYLIFDSDFNKDCMNLTSSTENENCIDCHSTHRSRMCYQSVWAENCYKCFYVTNSRDCSECYGCDSCIWCKNCFWCVNLRNKEYHIFNKAYSKEEYMLEIARLCREKIDFNRSLDYPKKSMISLNSENISWNYIYDSKNIESSYEIYNSENCKYCFWMHDLSNSYDVAGFWIGWLDKIYYSHVIWVGWSDILFSNIVVWNCRNIMYSNNIYNNCSDIFWCISMIWKQYCILNKQYSKEQYEELVPKIIEHMKKTWEWWEFFPSSISPFGYNETVAMEYFPIDKDNARFKWSTYENPLPQVSKVIPASKLPQNISEVPDDILNWAVECEVTNKPFRIVKQELDFYRLNNLPIPKKHPDERHLDRMKLRNPRVLHDRQCDKCGSKISTTYSPDKKEKIYCEKCYEEAV
ncbi:MAG: hypothetical protein ACD_2C00091G0003 [uncultured bacterium (gcode 4)]|uniref:Caib/baif family protein n=1 Tax=uncultured bacterium (gcode 4) TaxID=1234023 RepID=K2G684_9BACT|nr:MAG: hypothetical protein ACD_2C00091G0003 [uncultured bacterium (gcode 4)]